MLSNLWESLEQEEEDEVKKHLIKKKIGILNSMGPYGMYPCLLIVPADVIETTLNYLWKIMVIRKSFQL